MRELFKRLPVRHREFQKNAKAQVRVPRETHKHARLRRLHAVVRHPGQVGATLRLIQAYAVAEPQAFEQCATKSRCFLSWEIREVRFSVVSEKLRGPGSGRTTLMSTSGGRTKISFWVKEPMTIAGAARNWTQASGKP